ncbi:MAG: ATP-dependent zinc metalloprotease FtsH [Chloroflexi bacterium]|nr:ATP-dependent zinc metalloprotease FtsH [Chloroflexota bacterium]MCI0869876.1 ATP-dependent zinc metalloprotease FtsH [Chloroflexota bacterium]
MNKLPRRPTNPIQWILIGGAVLLLLLFFAIPRGSAGEEIEISRVAQLAASGEIRSIEVSGDDLIITTNTGGQLLSRKEPGTSVLEMLEAQGINAAASGIDVSVSAEGSSIGTIIFSFLPIVLFGGLIFFMMRRSQGGINQAMMLGRTKARQVSESPGVRFDDVAGADEAKQELMEVVEFLQNPEKFTKLGAKIPKGVLMVGPPGTGKTLISRAVAGEAGVPFFNTSGSEFVEMFVGVGASRVRDLFNKAKENAPAVIFIDEIDAIGRHRGSGIGGGHDEREQTLNQILVEMDGFEVNANVIVIAATNRPDILDPALIRPGRFDRRVLIDPPDVRGRKAILAVHMKGKPIEAELDVATIAKETVGFTGADLANVVNEAAIMAARRGKTTIGFSEFEEAVDRVVAGPVRKSRKVSEREKKLVAYHEAGHALVAAQIPDADPVHKVTIVARGTTGGYTRMLPDEERNLWSKGQFEAMLAVMMGGHAAEEVVFGDITTGASDDLEKATDVARKMVTEFGMSEDLGPRTFSSGHSQMFMGRDFSYGKNYSDAVAQKIDTEISRLLGSARAKAKSVIEANRDRLQRLADKLQIQETLQGGELQDLLTGGAEGSAQPAV